MNPGDAVRWGLLFLVVRNVQVPGNFESQADRIEKTTPPRSGSGLIGIYPSTP